MGNYFIRIDDATDLRRKVLESSKATIHVLRGYQEMLDTRKEKTDLIKQLRSELKELTMLMNRIENLVPEITKSEVEEFNPRDLPVLEEEPVSKRTKKSKGKKKTKKVDPVPAKKGKQVYIGKPEPKEPPMTKPIHVKRIQPRAEVLKPKEESELEKLHTKLSSIESKLSGL